ncbi:MAG TPA: dihydroorotase [Acidobacteriota bacterium]|nr:dihydroorotase [Acidobacteriota bacterium]
MTLLIRGGRVVDPAQGLDRQADVLVEDGKVVEVGKVSPKKQWEIIEAKGCLVTPGLIDMHVHLREPGYEEKETIQTGARAAVAGGFSSVACMPNTNPVNDCEAVTRFICERAREVGLVNVFPIGAVTKGSQGRELAEMGQMVEAGAVAFSDDGRPVSNHQIMRRAMEYAKIFDVPILDHCEDPDLTARGSMNESRVSTELGLRGANALAEELHVARDLMVARLTGARVHICHLSSAYSLHWVRRGKAEGVNITCEVAPHHLVLTDEAVRSYDTNLKMNPPLRTQEDVDALLEGLADGTVDCIATDHAPHLRQDKEVTFEEAAHGVIGLETAVSLVWEFLVNRDVISPSRAVELMSLNPSRILKLGRGSLEPGRPADVTLIDPAKEVVVDVAEFHSKGRNCPYHGWRLRGAPVMTIVSGRVSYPF